MVRVLIAGCGSLGSDLGVALVERGCEVWGLRRNIDRLPGVLRGLRADLSDPKTLAGLPEGLDIVCYTAAADGGDDDGYRRAYVDGPRHLLQALASQGLRPRRVLFTSSTAVYHQGHGEWVDEGSPTEPSSFRGQRMLEGERLFRDAPYREIVVRLGGIYGPSRTWLLDAVRGGRVALPTEDPPLYTNRIHERDCVGALVHLLQLESPETLFLGVDGDPASRAEVVAWLAQRLGVEVAREAVGGRAREGNKRCRNARLVRSGYRFEYPSYRQGYGSLL